MWAKPWKKDLFEKYSILHLRFANPLFRYFAHYMIDTSQGFKFWFHHLEKVLHHLLSDFFHIFTRNAYQLECLWSVLIYYSDMWRQLIITKLTFVTLRQCIPLHMNFPFPGTPTFDSPAVWARLLLFLQPPACHWHTLLYYTGSSF